jgi:hypothetical protein
VKDYGVSTPPFQVDWKSGKLTVLGEFVASRGSDTNWFTYSLIRIEPDTVTDPNFESPFAFYDLADDGDSVPELEVRIARTNHDDPFSRGVGVRLGQPSQQIRYSWDQDNSKNWTYKLGLVASNTIDETVRFPEFSITTVPYAEVPGWVVSHSWDIATFVAAEEPLWTTEGIYDWDPGGTLRESYWEGTSSSPGGFGASIDKGRRGEFALHLSSQPWLYFSPIDRRLHLESADAGIWNIDGEREIRYLNSGGGTAFDGWQLWDSGQLVSELYRVPGGLLYSDAAGTFFRRVDITDSTFRTLPPTNHDEWKRLGDQLSANQRDLPDGDLRAMFDQFEGDTVQVSSGTMASFERSSAGISFVVDATGANTQAALASLTGASVTPGLQTVRYSGSAWSASSATLAAPSISITTDPRDPLTAAPVTVTISNPNAFPIEGATLDVSSLSPDAQSGSSIGTESLTIPAGGTATFTYPWSPGRADTWTVHATVTRTTPDFRTGERPILAQADETVSISATSLAPRISSRLGWGASLAQRSAAALAFACLAGLIAAIALRTRIEPR